MADARMYIVALGRFSTSLNLEAQVVDITGAALGAATAMTELGNGRYYVLIEHKYGGAIVVTDTDRAAVVQVGALQALGAGGPYLYHGRALGRIGPSMAGVR